MTRTYQYYREKLRNIPLPCLVLDIALFYQNIYENSQRAGDKKIRIASKSIRCVEAMRMILASSAKYKGIMTYDGKETVYLAQQGFDDLLVGYPIMDATSIADLSMLIKNGKTICLMVDSVLHIDLINSIGRTNNVVIPICIEIDLSDTYSFLHFGVWRSGINDSQSLEKILNAIKTASFVRLEGVMGYEAQIAGVSDKPKDAGFLKSIAIKYLKNRSLKKIAVRRKEMIGLIKSYGFNLRFINGGGTGSVESTANDSSITEITIGSGFFNGHIFDDYVSVNLLPALFYGIPVTRKPKGDIYTCQGGGFIASGAVNNSKAPIVYLPGNGSLDKNEGAGEVQTPIRFKNLTEKLAPGDPIFLRHAKSGEICERFNHIVFLEKETYRMVNTYRGDGYCFG